jgi:hypothetical protein
MIHRDISRSGLRTLYSIAIVSFVATTGFSNRGWAQLSSASTADKTANKTINVFCRAAGLPHIPLPAEPLPAEQALSSADAKSTLDVIQQLSKTQKPLCSQNGAAPNRALKVIGVIVDPISHHPPLVGSVPPEVQSRIREITGQVQGNM